ncbi:hypothetical protein K8R04_02995 [Candidatus Uhrbacteria bacterium]|nr:hypothetical protein [Candidatus Uhrbacteria bacterium]
MERLEKREWLALSALLLVAGILLSYLPFSSSLAFLSPDETGVFVAAKNWAEQGSVVVEEKLATKIPWLHPRSWISNNSTIVPVGFLGWPWIISWFIRVLGPMSASIGAMLVILSCIYPLYRLMRPIGKVPAFIGTVVAVTSPAFVLYGNRSLFPNAAIVALALWCGWMFRDKVLPLTKGELEGVRSRVLIVLFGLLSGLMLAIRPVEAIWILPWFVVLGWNWRPTLKQALWIVLGLFIALAPLAWEAQVAYGGFWKAGYWMKGNSLITTTAPIAQNIYSPELFPFGIHPRSIASNAYSFLGMTLFPWMVPLLIMFALVAIGIIKGDAKLNWQARLKKFVSGTRGKYFLASLWTFAFLVLYYGNGRYLDNINGNATIGNSYIRYLLPLGFISALSLAWIYRLSTISKYGRPVVIAIAVLLAFTGIWRAYAADEEGLLADRKEVTRYSLIRDAASLWFKPGDIILSERSDKIFFPAYRAVSPLPAIDEASRLSAAIDEGYAVGLFVRPMTQAQADLWRKVGLEPIEITSFGREKLYRLQPVR